MHNGPAVDRRLLARVDGVQALVSRPERLDHVVIGAVGDVDKTDVVVFTVAAPGCRLVGPLKPVSANHGGHGGGILDVILVRNAALLIIARLPEPGREAASRRADVEFADHYRPAGECVGTVDGLSPGRIVVNVDAIDVEGPGGTAHLLGRMPAEAHAEI